MSEAGEAKSEGEQPVREVGHHRDSPARLELESSSTEGDAVHVVAAQHVRLLAESLLGGRRVVSFPRSPPTCMAAAPLSVGSKLTSYCGE